MIKKILLICVLAVAFFEQAFAKDNKKRPYILIVGSSTISPLMAAVSEEFSRTKSQKEIFITTPIVESTGTKSGIKNFCEGIGYKFSDFVNASRPIEKSEIANCKENGISKPLEIKIGYDGIVFAKSTKTKEIALTKEHIFLALAQKVFDQESKKLIDNPYKTWNQIDKKLPATKILVYGPPSSSGTRDVFVDMVMEEACLHDENYIHAIHDEKLRKIQCHQIRSDEHFIELDENDNSIIQNLKNNQEAFGIIGFNFLSVNKNSIEAAEINGIKPNQKTISSKKYPLSRALFVYFKKEHLNLVPEIHDFIKEIINQETIGSKGYLVRSGLVAMSDQEIKKVQKNTLEKLKMINE